MALIVPSTTIIRKVIFPSGVGCFSICNCVVLDAMRMSFMLAPRVPTIRPASSFETSRRTRQKSLRCGATFSSISSKAKPTLNGSPEITHTFSSFSTSQALILAPEVDLILLIYSPPRPITLAISVPERSNRVTISLRFNSGP